MNFSIRTMIDYFHNESECWKIIEYDYIADNMYEISSYGNVRRLADKTAIKPTITSGYYIVCLRDKAGHLRNVGIHRLVANAFCVGRYESDYTVNHKDGIKTNNHFMNLEWCSVADNNRHAHNTGLSRIPLSKTEKSKRLYDVMMIRDSLINNNGKCIETYNELKDKIPWLTYSIVDDIKLGLTWRDVTKFDSTTFRDTFLTDDQVHLICKTLLETDGSIKLTSEKLSSVYPIITAPVVDSIKRCHTHRAISKKYFDENTFTKQFKLSEPQVILIAKLLNEYRGYGSATKVFRKLQSNIPGLTMKQIRDIQHRKTHKELLSTI